MGNAAFWFYPSGSHLVTINLGEQLGELFTDFEVDAATGTSLSGRMRRVVGLQREIITIQRDRMSGGEQLAHKFAALQNHLDRGGSCAFTADVDKAFMAPIKQGPNAGDTRIQCAPNPFRSIVGTNVPAANDYVVIESSPPGLLHEVRQIHSSSNLSATADGYADLSAGAPTSDSEKGIAFTYDKIAWMRWYRSWPILKRPQADIGTNIVTNESGILWSLSLRLVPDYHSISAFHPGADQSFTNEMGGELLPPEILADSDLLTLDSEDNSAGHYGAFNIDFMD